MAAKKKVTKPQQAASPVSLDRYQVALERILNDLQDVQTDVADVIDSMIRAEQR